MPRRKYAFIFVCQQGVLEIKSLLLAASLKKFLRCEYELIAAVMGPEETFGKPSEQTLALLQQWGVRLVPIVNEVNPLYTHANKIACLKIPTTADKVVFMDTDILCMREFDDEPRFARDINLKPADLFRACLTEEVWQAAYAGMGLPMPSERMQMTVAEEETLPYFNSGFIAINRGIDLASAWLDCARTLESIETVPKQEPWSDQTSLPIAIQKLKLDYDCLDERYNFPVNCRPLNPDALPYFCHYHGLKWIRKEPLLRQYVLELGKEHPELGRMLKADPGWAKILAPYKVKPRPRWRRLFQPKQARPTDLLISGISRSGTSYLCSLLDRYGNCVGVNEPKEVIEMLAENRAAWKLPSFYRDIRTLVLDRKLIKNKVHEGRVIENTGDVNKSASYRPKVRFDDFVLAVQNTCACLNRLETVLEQMAQARMVMCVRDPWDTLASWKTTFPHLRDVALQEAKVGHVNDPFLTPEERAELQRIDSLTNPAERRAWWWVYFAEKIVRHRDRFILVNYRDLVLNPEGVMETILKDLPVGRPSPSLKPSTIRSHRDKLDAAEIELIREICGPLAKELGVWEE